MLHVSARRREMAVTPHGVAPLVAVTFTQPEPGTAERMAAAMITLNAEGGATIERLLDEGFTGAEIAEHSEAARRIAIGRFVRQDALPPRPYDREARIAEGVRTVCAAMPRPDALLPLLRDRGFEPAEVGDLWSDIITIAADRFAETAAPGTPARKAPPSARPGIAATTSQPPAIAAGIGSALAEICEEAGEWVMDAIESIQPQAEVNVTFAGYDNSGWGDAE